MAFEMHHSRTIILGLEYVDELIESGTLLTLIEMLSLENPTEADKNSSIRVVYSISLYGLKYKEIICKVGSIRVICECLGTVENSCLVFTVKCHYQSSFSRFRGNLYSGISM